jgi:hypothetical protein
MTVLTVVRPSAARPGDSFVTIEPVYDPAKGAVDLGTGINHLVVQVESLDELT